MKKKRNETSGERRKLFNESITILSSVLDRQPRMEFNGNREVIIEGSTGILEYTEEVVRINTQEYVLRFQGRNMQVRAMTSDGIIISGFIQKVDFLS